MADEMREVRPRVIFIMLLLVGEDPHIVDTHFVLDRDDFEQIFKVC